MNNRTLFSEQELEKAAEDLLRKMLTENSTKICKVFLSVMGGHLVNMGGEGLTLSAHLNIKDKRYAVKVTTKISEVPKLNNL